MGFLVRLVIRSGLRHLELSVNCVTLVFSATGTNMDRHFRDCKYMKHSIGALLEPTLPQETADMANSGVGVKLGVNEHILSTNINANINSNRKNFSMSVAYNKVMSSSSHHFAAQHNDETGNSVLPAVAMESIIKSACGSQRREELNALFSRAIHETATPFSYFAHESWRKFFQKLNPFWIIPNAGNISTKLLQNRYKNVMNEVIDMIKRSRGGVMGIDGATNRLSKSQSNVIVHIPMPLFTEYLGSVLQRETTVNAVTKIEDVIACLTKLIKMQTIYDFVSGSCKRMKDVRKHLQIILTIK